ncbi:MAG: cobalamin-dependent protein [Candidatus Andersenbacteria bacterium]
MAKPKVLFVKAAQESDATWDPIRMSPNQGLWYLASELREQGYYVRLIDETTRHGGLHKHSMVHRTIKLATKAGEVDEVYEVPVVTPFADHIRSKMEDFERLSPGEFVEKHSAFRIPGEINRTVVRTGNPIEHTLEDIERELASGDAVIVGIPLPATSNYVSATRLGKAIKDTFGQHVKVIYGGQHITAMPGQFLKDNPWVDVAVCGDAVTTIERALQCALDGTTKVVWRMCGDKTARQEDISCYPLLDPTLLEENEYPTRPNHTFDTDGRRWVDFMTSKGCGLSCEFCGVSGIPKEEKKYSAIPLDKLEQQLLLFKRADISELVIQDDAVLSNKLLPGAVALFKKHGFSWQNNGGIEYERIDDATVEQWSAYNRSGEGRTTALYVPFNPREWNEGQSAGVTQTQRRPHVVELLKKLRESGCYVFSSEIIGQPTERREESGRDTARYIDLVREGYIDQALTFSATVLPGTKWSWKHGALVVSSIDYVGYSLFTTHHRTYCISDPREIERWVVERNKTLNEVQRSYAWGTAFPNVGPQVGE